MRQLLLITLGIFVFPYSAFAVSLDLESGAILPSVGDPIEITLSMDAEGSSINALEGAIQIPDGLEVLAVRYGSSVVPFWIEQPKLAGNTISYAGIIPNGLSTSENQKKASILTFVLRARTEGEYVISIASSTQALLNDGLGTKAILKSGQLLINAIPGGTATHYTFNDTIPPEPFTPLISRSSELFNGDYFIAFSSTDRESGLSHYEIAETKTWTSAARLKWRPAISPERLDDQTLSSTIYIKAVDQDGNERISIIGPANRSYTIIAIISSIVILFMFIHFREYLRRIFNSLTGYTD